MGRANPGTSYVNCHPVTGRQGGTLLEFAWVLALMLGLLVPGSVLGEASSGTMQAYPDPAPPVLMAAHATGAGVPGPVRLAAAPSATSTGNGRQASGGIAGGIAMDRAREVGTSGAETKSSKAMEPGIPDAVVALIFGIFGLQVVSRRSVR